MAISCPYCQSAKVITCDYGRKVGGAIGTAAGAAAAVPRTLIAIETGALAARFAGPVGLIAGSMAGYVLSGLIGGYFGNAAGTALGEVIDENILDNYQCLACNHKFSRPSHGKHTQGASEPDFSLEEEE
jgi:hypothetical protein